MAEHEGQLRAHGRVAIVVSRYHERITSRLLDGALACCREAGASDAQIDVHWVAGAFELGIVVAELAARGAVEAIVALGAVIRGETPHFDVVVHETAAAIGRTATATRIPVGLGLLTCDTMEQATARAGGSAGNKGREAAEAALRTADLLRRIREN